MKTRAGRVRLWAQIKCEEREEEGEGGGGRKKGKRKKKETSLTGYACDPISI